MEWGYVLLFILLGVIGSCLLVSYFMMRQFSRKPVPDRLHHFSAEPKELIIETSLSDEDISRIVSSVVQQLEPIIDKLFLKLQENIQINSQISSYRLDSQHSTNIVPSINNSLVVTKLETNIESSSNFNDVVNITEKTDDKLTTSKDKLSNLFKGKK